MQRCVWAVVAAAGSGKRMGMELPKQYLRIGAKTLLEYSLQPLLQQPLIKHTVVVLSQSDPYWPQLAWSKKTPLTAPGGPERYHSVLNGLHRIRTMADPDDWVLVHDAARPCLRAEDLQNLIDTLNRLGHGGLLAAPVSDTVKRAGNRFNQGVALVQQTVDRKPLWRALTPQMFPLQSLINALTDVVEKGAAVTDEAEAMERAGAKVALVPGNTDNIKVTHQADLRIAQAILEQQGRL